MDKKSESHLIQFVKFPIDNNKKDAKLWLQTPIKDVISS